jgi:large subunit ribosomal protein L29
MKAEKIRNLTDVELKHQERDLADQLFKLKFQMNMGQTESLKKIRGLRRDIARVLTVQREQELAGRKAEPAKTATKTQPAKAQPVVGQLNDKQSSKKPPSKKAASKKQSSKTEKR